MSVDNFHFSPVSGVSPILFILLSLAGTLQLQLLTTLLLTHSKQVLRFLHDSSLHCYKAAIFVSTMSEKFDRPLIILVILSGEPQWRQETLSPSTSKCLHAITQGITESPIGPENIYLHQTK